MKRGKKIALGVFLVIGTLIIVTALVLVFNIFFGKNVNNYELTKNLDEFVAIYSLNEMDRDMPLGLTISEASCTIADGTYEIKITIENQTESDKNIELQLYYNEEFQKLRPKTTNPYIRVTEDDGLFITPKDSLTYTVRGTLGSDMDESSEALSYVYLEIFNGIRRGRLMLPLKIQ